MKTDLAYWQNYIRHAQTMKARYQLANLNGRHDKTLARIERDLQKAHQKMRACR